MTQIFNEEKGAKQRILITGANGFFGTRFIKTHGERYEILATDVADHLKEYATFKAMGYGQPFFLGIVFEEAIILAVFGFVPGLLASLGLYAGLEVATGLPMEMTVDVAIMVLLGTLLACAISGAIATRRLVGADPADLF